MHKVGQFPPWDTTVHRDLAKLLGESTSLFRKGLICEAQGYGIGAYGYYRRIVEKTIDALLNDLRAVVEESEESKLDSLAKAIDDAGRSRRAEDKIAMVLEILPQNLRPDGRNPLGTLHSALSQGIHSLDEPECLNLAGEIRLVLTYLTGEIRRRREAEHEYKRGLDTIAAARAAKSAPTPRITTEKEGPPAP